MVRSFIPRDFRFGDVFRRHAVNAHGHQLIGFGMLVAQFLDLRDELRRYAVDAERDHVD